MGSPLIQRHQYIVVMMEELFTTILLTQPTTQCIQVFNLNPTQAMPPILVQCIRKGLVRKWQVETCTILSGPTTYRIFLQVKQFLIEVFQTPNIPLFQLPTWASHKSIPEIFLTRLLSTKRDCAKVCGCFFSEQF